MRGERRSVRRVPGPVDVRDACCRLGLRRRARVLRGERRVPRARGVRDSALPVPARGSARVVLRARADARDLRLHELGPDRGRVRDGRHPRVRPAPRRRVRRAARSRRRREAVPSPARDPVRGRAVPGARSRRGHPPRVGRDRGVARGERALRARRADVVVAVLRVQRGATRRLGQPVVHRVPSGDRRALLRADRADQRWLAHALPRIERTRVVGEAAARAGLRTLDARAADPRAVPAHEQGLLAAVRAVAIAVVRARAPLARHVRRVLARRHGGVRDPLLVVRRVRGPRWPADSCVRGRRADQGLRAGLVHRRMGPPPTSRPPAATRGDRSDPDMNASVQTTTRRAGGGGGLRTGFVFALKVFLGVRVGLFVLGLLSPGLFPPLDPVSVPGWPARPLPDPGLHNLFTAWERFDGLWFLRIADEGYRTADGSAAFFPLYPLLVRFVSVLLWGRPLAAALLVSNAALLGALALVYDLTRAEVSDAAARTTVVLLCVFPTAFFWFAPYSESLFLLLAVAALRS